MRVEQFKPTPEAVFLKMNYIPEQFSPEEEKALDLFFSNTDKPVFTAHSDLPPYLTAPLLGLQSQSPHSIRRLFLDNFVKDPQKLVEQMSRRTKLNELLDFERARDFLRENFVKRGHDSLVATIPLIIGFHRVSHYIAKYVEDIRIGSSPQESSSRFRNYGGKEEGKYIYARSPMIMVNPHYAELYEKAIDRALDLYVELQKPVAEKYREKFPHASEWLIKRMTFDATRVLLVAGTFTNLGVMVNGQAAENMIIKLMANELLECQEIGQMVKDEIAREIPPLVERFEEGGIAREAIDYRASRRQNSRDLAREYLGEIRPEKNGKRVILTWYDPEGEAKVIAKILWPGCDLTDQQILKAVRDLPEEDRIKIVEKYIGERGDRRIKPGRAFEEAVLSFEIHWPFGEWRDIQRNRILTPYWDIFDWNCGYEIGDDLIEFGFGDEVKVCLDELGRVYEIIAQEYPIEAQYLVAFGTIVRYAVTLNFRELVVFDELRTGPGANEGYAFVGSETGRLGKEAYPLLAKAFQHVKWRE